MGAGRPRRRRTQEGEEVSDALYSGVEPGAISSTDIQIAINNGNRREDVFFMTRVGRAGSSGPYQQPIPQDFARYHPDLIRENVALENASGAKWVVSVRPGANVARFCKGWRAFSLQNNLRDGDQLIFTQVGKLHFKVTVYDCRGKALGQPPNGAEASAKATVYDCRGKGLAEPPDIAEPLPLQPLTVAARTEYPLTRPAVLDSNMAKLILRHILPPPPSGQVPDPITSAALTEVPVPIPAPTVDGTRDVAPNEEQNEMEVAEGKDYIFLDSDEDDELVFLEVAVTTLPKNGPKIVANTGSTVRMNSTGEQSGARIHSPSETQEVSTPEIEELDDSFSVSECDDSDDDDDDLPLTRLRRRGSGWMMNRRNYEREARKKICVRRPSWKGERINPTPPQAPSSTFPPFPITRRLRHHEVGESSQQPPIQAQEEDNDDGEAVRLVHQQGRKNFSDIVRNYRQHHAVSGRDKKCALDAAMEFSFKLKNHKFVAVMYAAQVYHGFYLPVPAEILEATGTQQAKVVEAWLTDKERKMYMVNWAWSGMCETPLLNNDGWAKFALDHFLEEGDVCVFQLLDSASSPTSGLLFHVDIFCAHRDGSRTLIASTFPAYQSGRNSAHVEWELRHKEKERKWPLSGDFRTQRRPSRTKLIKPRIHDHFGGSRGQRRF